MAGAREMIGLQLAGISIILIVMKLFGIYAPPVWNRWLNVQEKSKRILDNEKVYIDSKGAAVGLEEDIVSDKKYVLMSKTVFTLLNIAILVAVSFTVNSIVDGAVFYGNLLRITGLFFVCGLVIEIFWNKLWKWNR